MDHHDTNGRNQPWIVSTLADVARFFGVHPSTVRGDWRAAGMPGRRGRYDLAEIFQWWRTTFGQPQRTENEIELSQRKLRGDAECSEERAQKLRIENSVASGRYVDADDVRREWHAGVSWVKAQIEELPDYLTMFVPKDQQQTIQQETENAVNRFLHSMAEGKSLSEKVPDWEQYLDEYTSG